MDLASPSSAPGLSSAPGSTSGLLSPATVRFRMLVSHFMSPAEEAKLLGYKDGEVQLEFSPPNKTPMFIVLIDGAREEERSLRLRLGRFATEKVDNQHVVVVGNQGWMPDAMRKLAAEFSRISLYLLNSEGEIEVRGKRPLPTVMAALKAQRKRQLPVAGVPVFTGANNDSGLASESEADFAVRCERAEETKSRLREDYADLLKQRMTPITFVIIAIQAILLGLLRHFQTGAGSDNATALVQMGAAVPPFIKQGEWWRILASAELHAGLISGVLGLLVLLSLGTLLEKLLGSARFVTLHVVSALGAALASMLWPRGALVLISIGASATSCALLGAGAVLALDPGGLPPAEVARLRKIAVAGLITTAVLTFVPGVDRPTQLGGLLVGAVLLASGLLRPPPMGQDGKLLEPPLVLWLHRGVAIACGLLLLGSLALAILKGHPWQPDMSWKKRLSVVKRDGGNPQTASGDEAKKDGAAKASDEQALVRRPLGDSGASLELPKGLGEPQLKGEAGRTPVYEFGDLGENQQLLSVLVQRHPRPLKGKMLAEAFDQAVVQVKADKLRDDRVTVLKPPEKSSLDGWPVMELHVRMQETVQARGLVQTRSSHTIVLWYVYTDLLPEAAQLELKPVLRSLREGEAPSSGDKKDKKKKKR